MTKSEIIKSLNELVAAGTRKSTIEGAVGLPVNSLASVLSGKKEMPNKWVEKFGGYFERLEVKQIGNPLADKYSPENMALVKDAQFVSAGFMEEMTKKGIWLKQIEAFCEKRGWKADQLLDKFEELEKRIKYLAESKVELEQIYGQLVQETQNKPNTAPETEKEAQPSPKQENGQEGAENDVPDEFIDKHLKNIKDLTAKYAEKAAENKATEAQTPKTLEEVKALCPKNLVGLDRSKWISENRKLYNI